MNTIENKYRNSKIYKLTNNLTNKIYIGSTTQKLSARKACHKRDFNNWKNGIGTNVTSFELFENNAIVDICLVEAVSCNNKDELHQRERFHIENNVCTNKQIPFRTSDELKEVIKQRKQKYRENNKDKIKESKSRYDELNKERHIQYRKEYNEKKKLKKLV